MSKIPSIVQNIIKNLCDINKNGKLDAYVEVGNRVYDENSIFERACQSYNAKNNTVSIFKNGKWETENIGDKIDINIRQYELADAVKLDRTAQSLKNVKPAETNNSSISQIISDAINNGTAKKTIIGNHTVYKVEIPTKNKNTKYYVEITKNDNGEITMKRSTLITQNGEITSVKKEITNFSKENTVKISSNFQYDKKKLENYVINDAVDKNNKKITTFSNIYEIRQKHKTQRTAEEQKKLKDFNNMINYAIEAGTDYGVDPKLILCIIQQEVDFVGFGVKVTGSNGKGYMQITSSPILDFLNTTKYDFSDCRKGYKDEIYGQEMWELLITKGFNVNKAQTKEQKMEIYHRVYDKLVKNDDPDFNIRLGTLILRKNLNKSQGDVYMAAYNYNGSPQYRQKYGTNVKKFYAKVNETVPNDSTYKYKKTSL